jgi:hypothetical protein
LLGNRGRQLDPLSLLSGNCGGQLDPPSAIDRQSRQGVDLAEVIRRQYVVGVELALRMSPPWFAGGWRRRFEQWCGAETPLEQMPFER